jgi:response regulator RpfG family c-di-GMP phosphodiesterase
MSILDAIEGMVALMLPGDVATLGDAIDSVRSCAGRQFDPYLVKEFAEKFLETAPNFMSKTED